MKLKVKFWLLSAALLSVVLSLGTVSVWHLISLRRSASATAAQYDAMDRASAAAAQVGWLGDVLSGPDAYRYLNTQYLDPIRTDVLAIIEDLKLDAKVDDGDGELELDLSRAASDQLAGAQKHIEDRKGARSGGKAAPSAAKELTQLRQTLLSVSSLVPAAVRHHAAAAEASLSNRIRWMLILLVILLAISLALHGVQYQTLVRPLLWLRSEMKQSAARNYREPVTPKGDREFRDVAALFNGLARELADLYLGMEKKIIERSRELVRSERLASVGFLAAGVAHEINNPLSVISGYAEIAAKRLQRLLLGPGQPDTASDPEADAEAEAETLGAVMDAQTLIRDEAFRCKEITHRLLSLARGGGDGREKLNLDDVARQVAILTKGLRNYRDRRIVLNFDTGESLEVIANPTEMKQVLLNLAVNALEAVPPGRGEVRIAGQRVGEWVEVSVEDNGKGMSQETLAHVFEPFFTAKRGAGEPGTGLGLSITHAIIENHGGRIRAESRGPGRGSRFTVTLPARSPQRVLQKAAV